MPAPKQRHVLHCVLLNALSLLSQQNSQAMANRVKRQSRVRRAQNIDDAFVVGFTAVRPVLQNLLS